MSCEDTKKSQLKHVSIVMDGNGRWAKSRNLPRIQGHKQGINTVKSVIKSCLEFEIPYLSLFAFSKENWLRPADEVSFLMHLFLEALENEILELNKNCIKITFGGDHQGLEEKLIHKMQAASDLTTTNDRLNVHLAINYSGRWDILNAIKTIVNEMETKEVHHIFQDELTFTNVFNQKLSTKHMPEPDLLIRTSGEKRISNYYLWQLAYTELYFTDTLWPDFTEKDFTMAIESYFKRDRRFGRV